jgi:hypothetical protein
MRRGLCFTLVATLCCSFVHVAEAGIVDRTKPGLRRAIAADPSLDLQATKDVGSGIAIRHVRLEASPAVDGSPSVTLKFDLHNVGWTSVTDIVLAVSLRNGAHEGTRENASDAETVRPFTIKIRNVLMAGYSFDYEIRLRNVSLDNASAPKIEVVDAQRVADDVF